jgi:hypothetical protein
MPDVKDATEIVTDPANVIGNDTHTSEREVNGKRAVAALRNLGAGKAEARELISEAVRELGGRVDSEVPMAGGSGRPGNRKPVDLWFLPADKVRPEWEPEPEPDSAE